LVFRLVAHPRGCAEGIGGGTKLAIYSLMPREAAADPDVRE